MVSQEKDLCCQVTRVYCIFLKSSLQCHLNGRCKHILKQTGFFKDSVRDIKLRRCCSTGKDILCFIYEGNRCAEI